MYICAGRQPYLNHSIMRKQVLRLLSVFLLGLITVLGEAQTNSKLIIQTSLDDYGGYLTPLNENNFFVTIYRGESVPNPDNTNAYYDFTDITFLVSDEMELIDSLHYNIIEGYGTRIAHIHPLPDGNYLAVGPAYDSISSDFQLYLRWFNSALDLLRDSLVGTTSYSEQYSASLVNQAGNIVISGGYLDSDTAVAGNRFFIEMSPEGSLIQYFLDTTSMYRLGLVQLEVDGKYYQSGYPNKLVRLNTDFTIDTIITINGQVELEIRDFGRLNDSTLYYGGNFFVSGNPSPNIDMEIAFHPVSWNGEILPLIHFGAVDTLDFFSRLRVYNEGIYLVGTIHSEAGAVPSWYMVNKLNHDLEQEYQAVYGDGVDKFSSHDAMPTADGGSIGTMSVWDYIHFPGDMKQYDVVVVRFDANGQLVGRLELPAQQIQLLKLAPNPASDFVSVVDEQHCWKTAKVYDQQGRLVAELSVSDCNTIQTAKLKPTSYVIRLIDKDGMQAFARLIKQ